MNYLCVAIVSCALAYLSREARAFEIETPVSEGCHEELTLTAARDAGFPAFAMAPAPTDEQRRAMNDLVFGLPNDDPWSLALFIGVRSNDLKDNAPTNLDGLFHVHDDPETQDEHCIRQPEDDGSAGDVTAIAACRAYIIAELEAGGLLADTVDLMGTEPVRSYFRFRGRFTIALPTFAYHLGRAAHALQDSHTHSMRDATTGHIRHMLNYIDAFGQNEYSEEDDGYPHLSALDTCRNNNAHQATRIRFATEATTRMFAAIADPAPGRRARVEAVIDSALVLDPGCDAANRYCDAPELDETTDIRSFGCAAAGASGTFLVVGIGLLVLRRSRRRGRGIGAGLAFVALGLWSPDVAAQTPTPTPPAPAEPAPLESSPTPPPPVLPTEAAAEQTGPASTALATADASNIWHTDHWHFDLRVGASFDDPGAGLMVGIARTQSKWTVGFLAEWNPWFSFDRISVRPGVFNAYGTLAYRWFQGNRLTIATRIEAGSSTMLFELLGLDKYTTGIYLGGALATIRFPVTPRVALTFDPVHFAFPAPRPFGLPFFYKQYRVTIGVELRL